MNTGEQKVCPKLDTECDFKCGYDVHMSEESNDNANVCLSCEG